MKKNFIFLTLLILLFNNQLKAHGIGYDTYIIFPDNSYQFIGNLCNSNITKQSYPFVTTYNEKTQKITTNQIRSIGTSKSNCYIKISLNHNTSPDITCTPDQEFYLPIAKKWQPAYQLVIGDELLTKNNTLVPITHIEFIQSSSKVFIVEVKNNHNFFISRYGVLTHNIILPINLLTNASIPFGSIAGGSIGSFFGPIALTSGIILGSVLGILIKIFGNDNIPHYRLPTYNIHNIAHYRNNLIENNNKNDNTQSPKLPTEDDGYIPPKNWDGKKARHPKSGNIGWPDKDGNIWVPVGAKGHGGPHWDVQSPRGKTYKNVFPGGKIRPGKK